jgi:hypothetical protein
MYSYPPFGAQNVIVGLATMTNSMMNAFGGKQWKMHKWWNKMITKNKHNIITMVLLVSRTERMAETITTNNQIPHTIAKTTKTNAPEMIAADHPREIAPTPRRAAQAITTETAHHSMTRKRSTRKISRPPGSKQHHRKVPNVRRVTWPKLSSSKTTTATTTTTTTKT